jgi:hypothetical protein
LSKVSAGGEFSASYLPRKISLAFGEELGDLG